MFVRVVQVSEMEVANEYNGRTSSERYGFRNTMEQWHGGIRYYMILMYRMRLLLGTYPMQSTYSNSAQKAFQRRAGSSPICQLLIYPFPSIIDTFAVNQIHHDMSL